MRVLAVNGSYRKGRTIDTLMDAAIEAARQVRSDVEVEKVYLIDRHIEYCRNCMACKKFDPSAAVARCVIRDDMDALMEHVVAADAFLFGTPVNMDTATAVMKTFLERLCWTCARPRGGWFLAGAPTPRLQRRRRAAIIVSSGLTPPVLRAFFDKATPLIRSVCHQSLNARVVATMYAGAVQKRPLRLYLNSARRLGRKLVSPQAGTD